MRIAHCAALVATLVGLLSGCSSTRGDFPPYPLTPSEANPIFPAQDAKRAISPTEAASIVRAILDLYAQEGRDRAQQEFNRQIANRLDAMSAALEQLGYELRLLGVELRKSLEDIQNQARETKIRAQLSFYVDNQFELPVRPDRAYEVYARMAEGVYEVIVSTRGSHESLVTPVATTLFPIIQLMKWAGLDPITQGNVCRSYVTYFQRSIGENPTGSDSDVSLKGTRLRLDAILQALRSDQAGIPVDTAWNKTGYVQDGPLTTLVGYVAYHWDTSVEKELTVKWLRDDFNGHMRDKGYFLSSSSGGQLSDAEAAAMLTAPPIIPRPGLKARYGTYSPDRLFGSREAYFNQIRGDAVEGARSILLERMIVDRISRIDAAMAAAAAGIESCNALKP